MCVCSKCSEIKIIKLETFTDNCSLLDWQTEYSLNVHILKVIHARHVIKKIKQHVNLRHIQSMFHLNV